MPLEPPPMDERYESFEVLKADVQQHACKQGYAIITKHLKKDKKNEHVIKVILMCDQGWKQHISCATTHLKIMAMQQAVIEQHWVARQWEVEEHHARVTKPPIQSNEAVEELANEYPAPTPLRRQGTQARQPTKHAAEASTTQLNTKQVRRVWGRGIRQCFICNLGMLLRQNRVL